MTGKTHLKIGVAIATLTLNPFTILGSAIGSLLPDIDHKNSLISKYLHFSLPFKHREITHSLFALFLLSIFLNSFLPYSFVFGIVIGYFFHLLADFFTKKGICLLYPYKEYIGIPIFKTDSNNETFISNLIIVLAIIAFIIS